MSDLDAIRISDELLSSFVAETCRRYPNKSFGYFLSDIDVDRPTDFLFFDRNIRNDHEWRGRFEAYGDYYVEHSDAGFVAAPEEAWHRQKEIWARDLFEVAAFHSHHRHPANFSRLDYDMHVQRFDNLWHMIVSLRNPSIPVVRAFAADAGGVRELPVHVSNGSTRHLATANGREVDRLARRQAIAQAQVLLPINGARRPPGHDAESVWAAAQGILGLHEDELTEHFLRRGLLHGAADRFHQHVADHMCPVGASTFQMGTPRGARGYLYGEAPRHTVDLSPFDIGRFTVTNELYGLFDDRRRDIPARDRGKPVTGISWVEASLFAMWMGCRLPTEAEWEFTCAAGSSNEWCCEQVSDLPRYAWYTKNSDGEVHAVGTRSPNELGIFDLHGNIWEWCRDTYNGEFYEHAARLDPLCLSNSAYGRGDKVTRGGSMHAHAEMCRSRYRSAEPICFHSGDLGFRLVKDGACGAASANAG